MKHSVVLIGYNCRLRPVEISDSPFIVNIRNQPFAAGKIHATSASIPDQEAWIRRYFERSGDYYWIIENASTGASIGAIGLYDITEDNREGMPGRWVMIPQREIMAMAPIMLMYSFAFDCLHLNRLVLTVMPGNRRVRRFHELLGATPIAVPARYVEQEQESGLHQDWFELTQSVWLRTKEEWEQALRG